MQLTTPTVKERTGRLIMSGILACGMAVPSAVLLAQPSQAYAVDGTVTIENVTDNATSYKAYKVFTADIDDQDMATHLAWADANTKTAVLAYLDSLGDATTADSYNKWLADNGHTASTAHDDPQNAAEFINSMISSSANDTDFGTVDRTVVTDGNDEDVYSKTGPSRARAFAKALADAGLTATDITASNGTATFTAPEGFYLIVADDAAVDDAGTAPIWLPLGGSTTKITEKTALVTGNKVVAEDKDITAEGVLTWGEAADANTAQDLNFRLHGTLPANLKSFPSYHYKFTDTLPAGMVLANGNTGSVKVVAYPTLNAMTADTKADGTGGTYITDAVSSGITYANDVLTVDIENLLTIDVDGATAGTQTADKNTVIAVYYKAHIDTPTNDAVYGQGTNSVGNQDSYVLTYTADPISLADATLTAETAQVYSYQVEFTKHDKSNGETLAGAKYTVQVANGDETDPATSATIANLTANSDIASRTLYVQADGSLGNTAYEFTTDENGKILIQGLDEGTYIINETAAPSAAYQLQDTPIVLNVISTFANNLLTDIDATIYNGENASVNDENMKTRLGSYTLATNTHNLPSTAENYKDAATGKITFMTVDDKQIKMPLTGLPGVLGLAAIGFSLLGAGTVGGVAIQRASRRRD